MSPTDPGLATDLATALAHFAPDGLVVTDEHGAIVTVNERLCSMFGYTEHELLGQAVELLVPERLRHAHRAHRAGFHEQPAMRVMGVGRTLMGRRRDGSELAIEIGLSPVPAPDGLRVLAIVRDVTEQVALRRVQELYERQTALISDLRLRLLSDRPVTETLHALCMEVRESELAADACIIERSPDGALIAWGAEASPGVVELDGGGTAAALTSPGAHGLPPVALRVDDGLGPHDARLLRTFETEAMVIGPLGRQRAMAVACESGELSTSDIGVLTRLVVEVGEAVERAAARHDQQRLGMLEDRERIATDLHDVVIQRLFAAGMRLQALVPTVDGPVRDRLNDVVGELDTTIAEIRETIFALHSRQEPVESPAEILARVVADKVDHLGFTPGLDIDARVAQIDDDLKGQLGPVLNELLSNVARHADASGATVSVSAADNRLSVEVSDDGRGYDSDATAGRGLDNLHRRAASRGGGFSIEANADGSGSTAKWWVPT